jgi:hypothetical protein
MKDGEARFSHFIYETLQLLSFQPVISLAEAESGCLTPTLQHREFLGQDREFLRLPNPRLNLNLFEIPPVFSKVSFEYSKLFVSLTEHETSKGEEV